MEQIVIHAAAYRANFAELSNAFSKDLSPRVELFELLISTSQLYLDCLLFLRDLSALNENTTDADVPEHDSNISREIELRRQFRSVLQNSKSWGYLDIKHPMSSDDLQTREDYIDNYSLHLPEIHEETYTIERYARDFLSTRSQTSLVDLDIGLRHLAFNHVLFVQPALQRLSSD